MSKKTKPETLFKHAPGSVAALHEQSKKELRLKKRAAWWANRQQEAAQ